MCTSYTNCSNRSTMHLTVVPSIQIEEFGPGSLPMHDYCPSISLYRRSDMQLLS
jgi:hypothetical protein